ncbi:MAG TPA: glycosyltransferase [Candidatus Methylacidiphilales bacterium]|jgi:glycosyltransferase involved in cell wall biosynthesis|nr:glycosyltransferase [Candidatus Methylacidiphilales bacterium]
MSLGVSVIICCHNSGKRLPETLRHLAAQQVSADVPWEIVVVDNASTDDTATIAVGNWPAAFAGRLRVVSEPNPGLCYARIRGIREARHEVISFLDDDNWASSDWVGRVSALFSDRPEIGASGGRVEAVCEITPPDWFESLQGYYAVGRQHGRSGDITNASGTLLFGAGLNLRTAAVRELLDHGFAFLMSGREGNLLLSGEDTELCFALRAMGWRLWYDDDLMLRHFVSKERLHWDYARRLMLGMGKASVFLDAYLSALDLPPFDVRPAWKKTWLFQLLKALRQWSVEILSHPGDCVLEPEGSRAALRFESARGRLAMLWNMRRRYPKLKDAIARADWARAGEKRLGFPVKTTA